MWSCFGFFFCSKPLIGRFFFFSVRDCDPADGPHCFGAEHKDPSATIYDTVEACCGRLNWIDTSTCVSASEESSMGLVFNKFFVDYSSGTCLQNCEPGPFGCAIAPSSVTLYDDIDSCCSLGESWVDYKYCTSRSAGNYSEGWVVDYLDEKCGKLCSTWRASICSSLRETHASTLCH